jgi:hypothetical protein
MNNSHRFLQIEKAGATDYLFQLACGLFSSVIFAIDIFSPTGIGDGVPYVTVVLISIWSPRRYFTVFVALCSTLLTLIGFLTAHQGVLLWQALPNRIMAIFTIWGTALLTILRKNAEERREKAVAEREKALEDVKILRGFLPICASCKKIRDDQGYWNQIEDYIITHSEADFSHGMCPTCARSLYPDLYI